MMITLARPKHLPAINKIYNQAVDDGLRTADTEPISLDKRRSWFKNHPDKSYPVFIYIDDDSVLGWLSVSSYSKDRQALSEVVEVSYYVDYDHHNKGIASALMEHGLQFCRDYGYRIAVAILVGGNEPSIALLRKFGFSEAGRIPEGLNFNGEFRDHLYMYRKL